MEQTAIGQIAKAHQRIIYVEPNDVYDKEANNLQQGESLTPRYEDFCISFNLIIECYNRLDKTRMVTAPDVNGLTDENGKPRTYKITWGLTQDDLRRKRSSILQGNRGPDKMNNSDGTFNFSNSDYNYLTTYFTDISYNSYKNTEIEGLGVESVQISYESWYTPTVVIKFVDVRGSALWGREEEVHIDEQLMAENIFGAFFTMPYPLFRLQVKGFLGKPVTYQLTCSNFKGEFNAQTGNFEAVATFIGYTWSLMTDIPFTYLVAAPYDQYIGHNYWERHVNTTEWGLWNDGDQLLPPPRLANLFKNIEGSFGKNDPQGTPEQQQELQNMSAERQILTKIKTSIDNFIKALGTQQEENYFRVYDENEKKEQVLFFSRQQEIEVSADVDNTYKELCESIQQYVDGGFNKADITTNKYPNSWTQGDEMPKVRFRQIFNIQVDNRNIIANISLRNSNQISEENLLKLELNETGHSMTSAMANELLEQINKKNDKIKEYCYLIDFSNVYGLCKDRANEMDNRENDIHQEIQDYVNLNIITLLGGTKENGFKPFIGNVFKVIFCHLETFCHIMFDSAQEIYDEIKNGDRTDKKLGVNINNSPDGKFVPKSVDIRQGYTNNIHPWPAIYDVPQNKEGGYTSELANVYGWPGDLTKERHKFKEVQVVYGLQEGIQFLIDKNKFVQTSNNLIGFPTMPFDYNFNTTNIFSNANINNITDLAGYLGFRIASILGVVTNNKINDNLSKILGRMDAYNLYTKYSSITTFTSITKDIDAQKLEDIMLCKEKEEYKAYGTKKTKKITDADGKDTTIEIYRFNFETAQEIKQEFNNKHRHPLFKENQGNTLEYIHFYDNKDIRYVPTVLTQFINYQQNTEDNKAGKGSANFIYDTSDTNDLKFIPNYNENNNNIESKDWIYTTDSASIAVINGKEENYTNKYIFNIITDKSSIDVIKHKYYELKSGGLKVEDYEVKDDFTPFLETFLKIGPNYTSKYFKGVQSMLSGNAEALQLETEGLFGENMTKFNYYGWCAKEKNKVTVNDDGDLLLNGEKTTLSDLVIQDFKIYYGNTKYEYSLFGCPFYYHQNYITDPDIRLKVKALLFLHTFKYNFNDTKLNVFLPSNTKTNGATEEVPKAYLLLLGGLLWRKRQKKDPIVYSDKSNNLKYETCPIDCSLHTDISGGKFFTVFKNNSRYNCPIKKITGGITEIDYNIENQLIQLFENFAKNEFNNIANKYELKNRRADIKKTIEYKGDNFQNDFKEYYNILTTPKDKKPTYHGQQITPQDFQNIMKGDSGTSGLIENYSCITVVYTDPKVPNDYSVKLLFNEKDTEFQDIFKDLYFGTYIITDSCYRRQGKNKNDKNGVINIKKSLLESYLSGFVDACKGITSNETVNIGEGDSINVSKDVIKNRDLSVSIYYYLKNLWDKWLVISNTNAFDVKPFFFDNFIFTDSFYNNVYHRLAVNCEELLKAWTNLADNGSLFHFLSRICTNEGCIFLPVPDYVGFNGETQKHDIEMMENLFRPLPFNEMDAPVDNNKYVIMYTHKPSHIKDSQSGFPIDSYDIWSHKLNDLTATAKELFKFQTTNNRSFDRDTDHATREGYNVPSFGVAFSRQNNHIFQNLKVSMDNPVMTEQAIKAQFNIAKKAGNAEHTISFIGQDTFNVFTNYSYSVSLEMIGNAQICPLMYFQLMNIPMWRGTYMIYKVVHNMTPGNMITTVTAMKMNKYALPFNSHFFISHHNKNKVNNDNCDNETPNNDNNEQNTINSGDIVGLVGDSYAVGMTMAGFVKKASAKNITAKASYANKIGNISDNDTKSLSRGGAHTDDKNGIRNALNQGCNVIVIHLGLNGSSKGNIKDDLVKSVKFAKDKGAKKVFLCIPTCPSADTFTKNNKRYYNNIVASIQGAVNVTGCGIIDYRKLQNLIYNETLKDKEKLHPGSNGYSKIVDIILEQLTNNGVSSQVQTLTYNGGAKVTNERMKKILANTKRAYSDKFGWYTLKGPKDTISDNGVQVTGACTSGPTTWYKNAGIKLNWWVSASTATHTEPQKHFESKGFKLVWHGNRDDALKLKPSQFAPGDISTLHGYNLSGNASSHGAMWTGSDWRSDFIQKSIWVYGTNNGRDGNYSVCIWRHPDLQ